MRPFFEEDVAVVEVPVVERFGNPKGGEFGANPLEALSEVLELLKLAGGQSLLLTNHQACFICE